MTRYPIFLSAAACLLGQVAGLMEKERRKTAKAMCCVCVCLAIEYQYPVVKLSWALI